MKEFLELISPAEALRILCGFAPVSTESVYSQAAVGRVLARQVTVPHDAPPFNRSVMDGYAVRSADVQGAGPSVPVYLSQVGTVPMGDVFQGKLEPGQTVSIATGGVVPEGADAVVMVEYTRLVDGQMVDGQMVDGQMVDGQTVEIQKSAAVGQNVVHKGEDMVKGQALLPARHRLRPHDVGALCGFGIVKVEVHRKPVAGILATGTEIVSPETEPRPGQIRDINQYTMAAQAEAGGFVAVRGGIVPDDLDEMAGRVSEMLRHCDMVLMSGGSSVGVRDLTASVIEKLSGRIRFHGIAVKPGKPTICADVDGKPVVGMPGHPVSGAVIFDLFVLPLLRTLEGERLPLEMLEGPVWPPTAFWPARCRAVMGRPVPSQPGREEYLRVRLESGADGTVTAHPVPGGSAVYSSVVQATGLVRIPAGHEGISEGQSVEVLLYG